MDRVKSRQPANNNC